MSSNVFVLYGQTLLVSIGCIERDIAAVLGASEVGMTYRYIAMVTWTRFLTSVSDAGIFGCGRLTLRAVDGRESVAY